MLFRTNKKQNMGLGTQSGFANISYAEFIMLPFPGLQHSRYLLAIPFFSVLILIVTANSMVIYTVKVDTNLHSPMYVLIALLFAVNICGALTSLPKMLLSFLFHASYISLTACLVQMFFLYLTSALDCNLLLLMALDRYVAICHPLRYTDIMTNRLLWLLNLVSVIQSVSIVSPVVILASRVPFCRSNVISHFVCEHMALMRLSCGDITINKRTGLAMRCIYIILNLSLLLASYSKIIHTALKISSGNVRNKAFHTCGTHLMVIFIGYFTRLTSSTVFRVAKSASNDIHNLLSAIYLLFPWIVNPIIYGLRTKEIKESIAKIFKRTWSPSRSF